MSHMLNVLQRARQPLLYWVVQDSSYEAERYFKRTTEQSCCSALQYIILYTRCKIVLQKGPTPVCIIHTHVPSSYPTIHPNEKAGYSTIF